MVTAPDLIDPFHRSLHARLTEEINKRVTALAQGSAAKTLDSGSTVAENYAAQTSYIQALVSVLDVCEELEQERYGARKKDEDE